MTEKEKKAILELYDNLPKMSKENRMWILGYVEGLLAGKTAKLNENHYATVKPGTDRQRA